MNSTSTVLWRIGIVSSVLLLAVSPFATGQTDVHKPEPSLAVVDAGKKSSKIQIIYRPPRRDAPIRRVGGGTRGLNPGPVVVNELAPEEVSLTIREQPTPYWFVSQPAGSSALRSANTMPTVTQR